MVRIRKEKPKPHVVIPDTSALWHEDKQYVVAPDFDAFWSSYGSPFGLELIVPEVVKGELLFQQTTSAIKSLNKANQAFKDVEKITRRTYSHRVTEKRVREEVGRKFHAWAESTHAQVLPTPTNVIIWPELIAKAIWREPPFLFDPQDADKEKGFRDCLIMEMVKYFCSQERRDIPIAFLCKDNLLTTAVETALASDRRLSVYELISDFTTYLDLTKEKIEDAFIKALIKRVSAKFFAKGEPECLYFRDNVRDILQKKYSKFFENPEESEERFMSIVSPSGLRRWEPTDSGMFWISRSQFVKTDVDGQYIWLNTVTYVRQYVTSEPLGLLGEKSQGGRESRVLILPFQITWRARVTSDGRFWEYSYVNDELKGNQFKQPTDEDRKNWNIEEPKR